MLYGDTREPRPWQRPFYWLFHLKPVTALILCTVLAVLLAGADLLTPPQLNLAFVYALIIILATWNVGLFAGVAFALVSFAVPFIESLQSGAMPVGSLFWIVGTVNWVVTFALVVCLTATLRRIFDHERERSNHDPLTGAVNATYFVDLLKTEIARAGRTGQPFTVAYVDCDDFKSVNTRYGHRGGDAVLRSVVETAKGCVRTLDMVARVGGDEFAILFPQTDGTAAHIVLERLRSGLGEAMSDIGMPMTVSIGALTVRDASTSADAVLSASDDLMFRAKDLGKNRISHETLGAERASAAA